MRPRAKPEAALPQGLVRLVAVAATAALWVGLYTLNDWALSRFAESKAASWIFLPAALRLLAVLLWGWAGALGLWIGAVVTASLVFGLGWSIVFIVAPASGLAPLLAVRLLRQRLGLRPDLQGLGAGGLVQLAAASATCSALLHSLVFLWLGSPIADPADMLTMLVGDLAGTFVVLYALKLLLAALPRR